MRSDAINTIEAASELRVGAGCREKQNLPAKDTVFLLDIPFCRTRPPQLNIPTQRPAHGSSQIFFHCFQLNLEILGVVVHNRSPWH
jgi:hypothetical protein